MVSKLKLAIALIGLISCQHDNTFFASLQRPMINGRTWCGAAIWDVKLMDKKMNCTKYRFEMNKWYGEPNITCLQNYKPFSGLLFAHKNQVDFVPDTGLFLGKDTITLLKFDLAPNTIIDSVYDFRYACMGYITFIDKFEYFEDTLYKFEWNNVIRVWNVNRHFTDVYFSKTRGLCGLNDRCEKYGGTQICAIGYIPDGVDLQRDPYCPECGEKW